MQVYVKHMCESVQMTSWGRVYYTNALALLPLIIILPSISEQEILYKVDWNLAVRRHAFSSCCHQLESTQPLPAFYNYQVLGPLILSCLVGVCMSHASYLLRDAVSATMFTIVGIVCKVT
jgi:solute carrier family 35 protein